MPSAIKQNHTLSGGVSVTDSLFKIVRAKFGGAQWSLVLAVYKDQTAMDANSSMCECVVTLPLAGADQTAFLDACYTAIKATDAFSAAVDV